MKYIHKQCRQELELIDKVSLFCHKCNVLVKKDSDDILKKDFAEGKIRTCTNCKWKDSFDYCANDNSDFYSRKMPNPEVSHCEEHEFKKEESGIHISHEYKTAEEFFDYVNCLGIDRWSKARVKIYGDLRVREIIDELEKEDKRLRILYSKNHVALDAGFLPAYLKKLIEKLKKNQGQSCNARATH